MLLARLDGYLAEVFTGSLPRLASSKKDPGWCTATAQRAAPPSSGRENQAAEAIGDAADITAAVSSPFRDALDVVVLGDNRRAIASLRRNPRLARYFAIATERFLTVPCPRLVVQRDTPRPFSAIRIRSPSRLKGPERERVTALALPLRR